MSARVIYSKHADKDLQRLSRKSRQRIYRKIRHYAEQDDPLKFAKRLKLPNVNRYRYRIGEYRAIFSVGENGQLQLLKILRVKHRKDVYE